MPCKTTCVQEQQSGPSYINLVPECETADNSSEDYIDPKNDPHELCCVCNLFTQAEFSISTSIEFTKWAQCDGMWNNMPCNNGTILFTVHQ
jgi:hypothetical protein